MATKLNKISKLLTDLNRDELAALRAEIEALLPFAPEPTAEEKLLAPGHYFEERTVTTGKASHVYLYERWYERDGRKLVHKANYLGKGTKAEFVAKQA
ncbi:MAG: hypothetical protein U0350_40690 [Caldilineaceae bacterium]